MRTEKALKVEIEKLQDAVEQLPGGNFKLRLIQECHLSKAVNFLGHTMKLEAGKLRTTPSDGNWATMMSQCNKMEDKYLLFIPGKTPKAGDIVGLAKMLAHTDGWAAAFIECDNIEELAASFHTVISQSASAIGATMKEVKAAIDASMTYRDTGYSMKI